MTSQDGRTPIVNLRVLEAMRAVPRHRFVPPELQAFAYEDRPLPIGEGQTISQPYIVALMTELADLKPHQKVLEIGTGSGYQAAVLARLTDRVYTIELIDALARRAKHTLLELGLTSIHVQVGDGYLGWPEEAPFDAIIVTAAAPTLPEPLVEQLAVRGRLVIPMGEDEQELVVFRKKTKGLVREVVIPVRFVPMMGRIQGALKATEKGSYELRAPDE
ncbi:MAG: protein-L-isoaspartate(D-aspartate) O-methyltransferase [Candidatus Omnitrophica bacterium]|nr:protein-L-isoaspartate(D-aspartate) O-methyltransferase [Candidatus Omnitrophota bacterium]